MSVRTLHDRSMCVQPGQVVRTAWVPTHRVRLHSHGRVSPEAVEKKFRTMLANGDTAAWPPPVGHWERDEDDAMYFLVCDGRHEVMAAQMLGRERVLVAWLSDQCPIGDDWRRYGDVEVPARDTPVINPNPRKEEPPSIPTDVPTS